MKNTMKKRMLVVMTALILAFIPIHASAAAGGGQTMDPQYTPHCAKHALEGEYYTGVNRHVGTQHQLQYGRKCAICGFVYTWWGEPYPCPGKGFCILPYSLELTEK